ncbi:hypothetical protein ACFZDK_17800 [Streptomyces sp. NPDC007901]|uniref:hypothetical protein n=1 Tax=Streptomyces sp. NPDC007901 TaxID=3364785 RepID=UPI0036EE0E65
MKEIVRSSRRLISGETAGTDRAHDGRLLAGTPGSETFTLRVYGGGQYLRHPQVPGLQLPKP